MLGFVSQLRALSPTQSDMITRIHLDRKSFAGSLLLLFFLFASTAHSTPIPVPAEGIRTDVADTPILPTVTVESTRLELHSGLTILEKNKIDYLPSRNGSLNETLSTIPGIQYGENMSHSYTAGEILPPNISVSGGKPYENNFTLDGISNNSNLDPNYDTVDSTSRLPGRPQKIMLPQHLIEQITTFDSNVPAEYGGFTGGVIDATTLDPTNEFNGKLNYRTTRNKWTVFNVDPDEQVDFDSSNSKNRQPKFRKHDAGLSLNIPFSQNTGVLAAYQTLRSEIPLTHLGETNAQTRKSETWFLKALQLLPGGGKLSITGTYSPYEGKYFLTDTKNSDYTIHSDAFSVSARHENRISAGQLESLIAFSGYKVYRRAPQNKFRWNTTTTSIDWSGHEGGNGSLDSEQKDLEAKSSITLDRFPLMAFDHTIKLGAEISRSTMSYDRKDTSYWYTFSSSKPAVLGPTIDCSNYPSNPACIDGEQFLTYRFLYRKGQSQADVTSTAAYLQDTLTWNRFELKPGVRISHDDASDHTNIAPRFAASVDLFDNNSTVIFAGKNRYYSGSLMSYKLREAIPKIKTETYNSVTDTWNTLSEYGGLYETSNLKTPYTDETTAGFIQKLLGGKLLFKYIKRINRDELAQQYENTTYTLNNNGKSEHDSYQLSWSRSWSKHYVEVNATVQKTLSSNNDYDERIDADDTADLIYYEGQLLPYDQIPKEDFNRPYVINLIYHGNLAPAVAFTNTTKVRGPYWKLKRKSPIVNYGPQPDGSGSIYEYEKTKMDKSMVFDWRIAWKVAYVKITDAILTLDIYNVFNTKIAVSDNDNEFELGRQIWAGMELNF